jgi:peptide/nickel transport system substrate-binding protein
MVWKIFKKPAASNYQANDLDQELVKALAKNRLPGLKQIKYLKKFLSSREKLIMVACILLLIASLSFLWSKFYAANLRSVPDYGGEYVEGLIGAPQYINPLHASLNSVDAAIAKLVYSSLYTRDDNGNLTNDLADSYDISPDGKVYTVKITDKARWTSGEKVTADDVVFTFNTIQDPQFRSPLRLNFQGVNIDKIDDATVRFTLSQSYAPFRELLTFGIMPKSLWEDVSPYAVALAELNLKPVGSGPYQFQSLVKDKNGNIKTYTLVANNNYYRGRPYLDKIICRFFVDQNEALSNLNNGKLDGLSYLDWSEKKQVATANSFYFHQLAVPEYTAVWFNLSQADDLSKLGFRQALALATDREKIKQAIYGNAAQIINGPILPQNSFYTPTAKPVAYDPEQSLKLLSDLGWTKGAADASGKSWLVKNNKPLTLTITTPDVADLVAVANALKEQWEALGIKTQLAVVDKQELASSLIKSRTFSLLLYNVAVGHDPDPFPLWHSSQATANGFNLTGYKNAKVDNLLSDARAEPDPLKRQVLYQQFEQQLTADYPAIWLFSQPYTYLQNKKVKGFSLQAVINPEDRFNGIAGWYLKEKKSLKL